MRVLFDASALGRGPSGTRTRLLGLVPELVRGGRCEIAVLHGPGLEAVDRARLDGAVRYELAGRRGALGRTWHQDRIFRRVLRDFPADRVVAECLPFPRVPGLIPVIHDLRRLHGGGLRGRLARRWLRRGIARAAAVVAVSHSVAAELAREFPELSGRVAVVPNGVDLERMSPEGGDADDAILQRRHLDPPYLLVVGHLEPRKNPEVALRVRELLGREGLDLALVFVGSGPVLIEEGLAYLHSRFPGQRRGVVLRDVGIDELPALYRRATALLAPAWLEGFGLVPLEALACGTPVLASDIPAHREVLGDAAGFAAPADADSFARQILDLRHCSAEEVALRRSRGIERAARYSWSAAADAFLAALTA